MTMSTIPYRLPKVIAAVADGAVIYIAEGEKDCSSLAKFSVVATCNTDGGGRWPQHLSEHFRGARVRIIPANDKTGRIHCRVVGAALQGIAASIDVLELPDLPEKGDVSDWLAIGGTADKLNKMAGRPWTEWVAEQPAGVETFSATRPDDAADKNRQKTSNFAACGGVADNRAADGQDAQVRCAQGHLVLTRRPRFT
jgi:hypothetical protein